MDTIEISKIVIPAHQRELDQAHVQAIAEKMHARGYNVSYPITINRNLELVDGGHRVAAAEQVGIESVPFVYKPDGVSDVAHAITCNDDGADTKRYDVFDYVDLCWIRAQQGWKGQQIANELGWDRTKVVRYQQIKCSLYSDSWDLAKSVPSNSDFGTEVQKGVGTSKVPIGTPWQESHFRALLQYLAYDSDNPDDILAQEQIKAIAFILKGFAGEHKNEKGNPIKVTAKWIEKVAKRYAWRARLKRHAQDNIKGFVQDEQRKAILDNIDKDEYGKWEDAAGWERLVKAVEAVNRKAPQLYVGRAENMDFIKDETIDVIITSPPYNIGRQDMPMGGDGRTPREDGIGYDQHSDDMPEDKYQAWQLKCLQEMYRVAKNGASLFYNHKVRIKDGKAVHPMEWIGNPENPWTLRQEIVWDRGSTHNHNPVLFWPHDERIYWMTKGKPRIESESIGKSTVWQGKTCPRCGEPLGDADEPDTIWKEHGPVAGTWHPAPFTPELPKLCLKALGLRESTTTVLDPFAGSCTTIKVATTVHGYDAIGVDISKEYLDKAKEENGWTTENDD